MSDIRMFPMQGGPALPWNLAEMIYGLYSDLYGKDQTIERLAERGGFGWAEVEYICQKWAHRFGRRKLDEILLGWRSQKS